ncbi:MAG TPA: VanZ family protein [Rhodocyclaceae bacterium]
MALFVSPLMRRLCLACAVLMVFLLFYLGAKPIAVDLFPEPWDKLAHFVAYGTIAGLLALGVAERSSTSLILLVSLVGALDEWHQVYLPGRSSDVTDFITDVVAAIVAVTLVDWLRLRGLVGEARCRS